MCREGSNGRLLVGHLCAGIHGEHVQIRVSCHTPPKASVFVLCTRKEIKCVPKVVPGRPAVDPYIVYMSVACCCCYWGNPHWGTATTTPTAAASQGTAAAVLLLLPYDIFDTFRSSPPS